MTTDFGIVYIMRVSDRSPYGDYPIGNVLEFRYSSDRVMARAARDAISRGMFVTMHSELIKINKHNKEEMHRDSGYYNRSSSVNCE